MKYTAFCDARRYGWERWADDAAAHYAGVRFLDAGSARGVPCAVHDAAACGAREHLLPRGVAEVARHSPFVVLDVLFVALVAAALTALRKKVQSWASARAARLYKLGGDLPLKYSESVWKILFYACSLAFGAAVLHSTEYEYLREPASMWRPMLVCAPIPRLIRAFYLFELGFYVHSLHAHLFIEVRRKDFYEMLVHHVATIFLIALSFGMHTWRVGVVIVVLHDVSDVILEYGKTHVYRRSELIGNTVFGVWVLSWAALRLTYFPFVIIRSCVYDSARLLGVFRGYYTLNGLLIVLLTLHVIWFGMILKLLYRIVSGTVEQLDDIREESEADAAAKEAKKRR